MSSQSKSKRRLEVRPLSRLELARLLEGPVTFPVVAYAGYLHPAGRSRRAPKLIGYGGLAWRTADEVTGALRCELWFEVADLALVQPLVLVHWARRMLRTARQMGDAFVFCVRADRPHSERLLTLVGMRRSDLRVSGDGAERPGEIWLWTPSSPPDGFGSS